MNAETLTTDRGRPEFAFGMKMNNHFLPLLQRSGYGITRSTLKVSTATCSLQRRLVDGNSWGLPEWQGMIVAYHTLVIINFLG